MLKVRIIPCLDLRDGRVVKGVRFSNLRDSGSPVELAKTYEEDRADELVLLDVSATPEGRRAHLDTIRQVREVMSIPMTTGGGVKTAEDAKALLEAGADKVSVNTAAVGNPELISEIAGLFGRQCAILALDAARVSPRKWEVVTESGKNRTGVDAMEWAARAVELGAGEILLTSWDRDGTRSGYDLELLRGVRNSVSVPIIASGGANSPEHMYDALEAGASAVLAASIFHEGNFTVEKVKLTLRKMGIEVRL